MVPRVRQTRHYEMFEWRPLPLLCQDCKTTASSVLASGANGILLNMQFVSRGLFLLVCFGGKSLCKAGICARCLQFCQTAASPFSFFSSMLLIPVTIENMQFAVLTQLPWCIFQSESVLNGVISLWVKKCQFQISGWFFCCCFFLFPWPVLSQTQAVTEIHSLLTSSANRVPCVESRHQELCSLKYLGSYFPSVQTDIQKERVQTFLPSKRDRDFILILN